MQTSTFKTAPQKVYSLDADTRFLMRVRAMEDNPRLQSNRKFHSVEELKSHIDTITESRSYFTDLKCNIGAYDCTTHDRRRTPLKIKNVWKDVSNFFSHKITAGRLSKMNDIDFLADIFGFDTIGEMKDAAITKGYRMTLEGCIDTDVQDCIAQALGFKNWLQFTDQDDQTYLVSETVLQRAYGIYGCKSAIRENTLNYISQYICDMNWQEYDTPQGRKKAYDLIVGRIVKPQMKTVVNQLYSQTKAKTSPFPEVKEGERITITHTDGTKDTYEYIGGEYHYINANSELCA